ncbi:DUF2381 family protein [Corallococcus exiguus]|uniref:DUF2381 family protein n=1 Tax=Corallococcus TaxID=83461 RepID=UPI000EC7D02B|nr:MULTISPECIES: DUF2381 family protein [Corallococcus]NNC02988.1 DUF2381 family protein [Corallococcus exiguus]NPC47489.1 DUF2381 family protein [Corallococcus exiguus]RKH83073.1 DUF2381 family protein [Corallococcus sp. AB032C]
MLQPFRLALALALVTGAVAWAEQAPGARVRRERPVTVASTPTGPLPVVHVAGDTPTVFLFSSPIQRKTLTFDESRIRVLDAGERSIIVQPVANLGDGERQELGVFFADGHPPTRAAFVLVTDPTEVDSRIDVQRPEPPNTACQPMAQAPAPKPEDFVLLGYVDAKGVTTSSRKGKFDGAQGLNWDLIVAFRGTGWILADVRITNNPNRPAWTPREATFVGRVGMPLRARLVTETPGAILPGNERRVLAVVEVPETEADLVFALEMRGDGERHLTIPGVRFPKPAAEDAQ